MLTRADFNPYVRQLADLMGLKDWSITVTEELPPSQTAHASIWLAYGRKRGEIYFSNDFMRSTPEEKRQTVVHELLHPHFHAMDSTVEDWLDDDKQKAFRRLFEYGIDAVADVIAPFMPLPQTPAPA